MTVCKIEKIRYSAQHDQIRSDDLVSEVLEYYDITCVTSGVLDYRYNGIRCTVKAGDIIVFPPGCKRERDASDGNSTFMSINFYASEDTVLPFTGLLENIQTPRLLRLFHLFFDAAPPYCEEKQIALLTAILYEIAGRVLVQNSESPYTTILKEYIHSHLQESLTVESLAALVHLHPTYCGYVFKKDTNMTLSEYICQKRISKAKNYLRTHNVFLQDIPQLCGFSGYKYFSKVFKAKTGMSPLYFRKNNRM